MQLKQHCWAVFIVLLFFVYSCDNGYDTPREVDIKEYNEKIENGLSSKAGWASTPQEITKHLVPPIPHEGNTSYSIEEKRLSDNVRKITVTDEGAFDDEVDGKRTTLYFKVDCEKWKIDKMSHSVRRIDK